MKTSDLAETYNRIADDWLTDHADDDWWVKGTRRFVEMLPAGGAVLDVGCGAGVKSRFLTSLGLKVTGIDVSKRMIELAKERVPEVEFRFLDLREAGQLGQAFDAVFAQAFLLHVSKFEAVDVISRLTNVLKPGGYFYVAVKEVRPGQPNEEIKHEDDYGYPYERFFSYYQLSELHNYFKKHRLVIVYETIETHGRTNWIQVVGRKEHRGSGSV